MRRSVVKMCIMRRICLDLSFPPFLQFYLQFSGQRLALVMIKTAIIALISNYTWVCTKQEESDTDVAVHFFNYAADGLNVNFKKRKQEL